jgi:hypothetical protein
MENGTLYVISIVKAPFDQLADPDLGQCHIAVPAGL